VNGTAVCSALPIYAVGVLGDMVLTYVHMFWLTLFAAVASIPAGVCAAVNHVAPTPICFWHMPQIACTATQFAWSDAEKIHYDTTAICASPGIFVAAASLIAAIMISTTIIKHIRCLTKQRQ
jgi:hypothetical protein